MTPSLPSTSVKILVISSGISSRPMGSRSNDFLNFSTSLSCSSLRNLSVLPSSSFLMSPSTPSFSSCSSGTYEPSVLHFCTYPPPSAVSRFSISSHTSLA